MSNGLTFVFVKMSVNETEFVDIRQDIVQDELNIKVEDCSGDEEDAGDEFSASESKCGDIFHSANGLFVFCCYYCSERFATIEEFVSHFEGKHVNTLIPTKTDEAPPNLQDVEETNEYLGSQGTEILPWITDNSIRIEENLDSGICLSTDLFNEAETNVEKTPKVYSEKEIQCPKCPSTFRWKNDLVSHLRQLHKNYSGNETGDTESDTKIDRIQGNGEMSFECSHCSKSFCRKNSLQRHLRLIHNVVTNPKTRKSLTCRFCDMSFSTIEEAETHEDSHTVGDRFQCHTCLKTFKLKRRLELHKLVHAGEMPFKCSECPKAFVEKKYLVVHQKRLHFYEKNFQCDYCEKRFFTMHEKILHTRIHVKEKPFKCTECLKEFPYKCSLTAHHKRVHLKEKNFSCDHCEKRFASNADRKSHMRTHFNEKPYQCEECGRSFTTAGGLAFHKLHHTQKRRHTCEICQKSFYTTVDLRYHMPVHTKEKHYQCTVCQSKFTCRSSLRAHSKLHSEKKNYACTICKKAFAQSGGLKSHMRTHGVQKTEQVD